MWKRNASIAGLLAAAVLLGCEQRSITLPDPQAAPDDAARARTLQPAELEEPCGTVVIVALRDAALEPMGEAEVWNGPTRAYVRFTAPQGWEVTEVRVEGKRFPEKFPRTGGVVDPSLFQFGGLVEPAQPEVVVEGLHLDNPYGVLVGEEVLVAAFARLRPTGGGAEIEVWAEGTPFEPGEHAMYLPYALQPCVASLSMISVGLWYTCGLTASGTAYCWGHNVRGQLGDGTTTTRHVPTAVAGGLSFTTISAGHSHTCGIATNGRAYCWGNNVRGQLGDGTTTERHTPTLAASRLTFTAISAGDRYTCGIATNGRAYCWGSNSSGQLGDGTTTDRLVPTSVAGGLSFAAISARNFHTCGIAMGGRAYCWGSNSYGKLGDGTTTNRLVPTLVVGGLTLTAISVGNLHTCGIATNEAGYCWGLNLFGQLGDGTTTGRLIPTPVAGGLSFSTISAGFDYTCGIAANEAGYCWGSNHFGELGDGTTTGRLIPTPVAGGLSFTTISAGNQTFLIGQPHTCGIVTGTSAYCWGSNSVGQLGDGTTTDRLVPTPVSGIGVVRSPRVSR